LVVNTVSPRRLLAVRVQEYVVSASGQMSLPASARHRWNLDAGGPVDVIDLGFRPRVDDPDLATT
jgi:hypothetical protein